jgi:hypothetical protein
MASIESAIALMSVVATARSMSPTASVAADHHEPELAARTEQKGSL